MKLPAALADQMIEHVQLELPNEGCGLVAGQGEEFAAVYCLDNVDASPTSYTIDPDGHFRALQDAEQRGWDLVGAFHSHIHAAAYPSATDVAGAAEPSWTWFIVGPMIGVPEIRAFQIEDGLVAEHELAIQGR